MHGPRSLHDYESAKLIIYFAAKNKQKKSTFFVHAFARPQWAQWKLSEGSVGLRFIFTYSIISSNIICLSVKFYMYTLDSVLLFVLQWETAWGPRWRETSWQTSTTRLLSNCTMVSQPGAFHFASRASEKKTDFITVCLIALNSRNFPLSCFLIYCWIGFDWNSCICSIPDWGEVVLDPRLSQRRRSLHETLQRGESSPLDFAVLLAYGQTGIHLIIPYYLALVMLSFLTVSLFLTLLSVCLHPLPGDVHRGGCEVLSSRAGIRAGPPP